MKFFLLFGLEEESPLIKLGSIVNKYLHLLAQSLPKFLGPMFTSPSLWLLPGPGIQS